MAEMVISHATLHFLPLAQFKWQEKCLQEPWHDILHSEGSDPVVSDPTHDKHSTAWSRNQLLHVKKCSLPWGTKGWDRRTWNFYTYLANGEAGKAPPKRKTWVRGSRFCREEGGRERVKSILVVLLWLTHPVAILCCQPRCHHHLFKKSLMGFFFSLRLNCLQPQK